MPKLNGTSLTVVLVIVVLTLILAPKLRQLPGVNRLPTI